MTRHEILNLKVGDWLQQTVDLQSVNTNGRRLLIAKDDAKYGDTHRIVKIVSHGEERSTEPTPLLGRAPVWVQIEAVHGKSGTITSGILEGEEVWRMAPMPSGEYSPRPPTELELDHLTRAMFHSYPELYPNDSEHLFGEVKEELRGRHIAVYDRYVADGPGYAGPVLVMTWGDAATSDTFLWRNGQWDKSERADSRSMTVMFRPNEVAILEAFTRAGAATSSISISELGKTGVHANGILATIESLTAKGILYSTCGGFYRFTDLGKQFANGQIPYRSM